VKLFLAPILTLVLLGSSPPVQEFHGPFDKILDTYVREGNVYYRALQIERKPLDAYVLSLDLPAATVAAWPKNRQLAFWINAYNAFVLQSAIDKYPIKGTAASYPAKSIQQIPGVFQTRLHRVAGQSLTLDAIEKIVIGMGDARALFALGRGAVGSGRLKSEAYRAETLDAQLETGVKEFVVRVACFKVDVGANVLTVSPLFGWRQDAFVASYLRPNVPSGAAPVNPWATRSPLEQAILVMASPKLYPSERDFLLQNTFQLRYGSFDWRLNDLTGGPPN
jgi:hypothetical protein